MHAVNFVVYFLERALLKYPHIAGNIEVAICSVVAVDCISQAHLDRLFSHEVSTQVYTVSKLSLPVFADLVCSLVLKLSVYCFDLLFFGRIHRELTVRF